MYFLFIIAPCLILYLKLKRSYEMSTTSEISNRLLTQEEQIKPEDQIKPEEQEGLTKIQNDYDLLFELFWLARDKFGEPQFKNNKKPLAKIIEKLMKRNRQNKMNDLYKSQSEEMFYYGPDKILSKRYRGDLIDLKRVTEESKLTELGSLVFYTYYWKITLREVNALLAQLEFNKKDDVVRFLKQCGLYEMLYHRPKARYEKDKFLRQSLIAGLKGIALSALITVEFAASVFFAAPAWAMALSSAFFVGASIYLCGLLYGVLNDVLATNMNLPYFLVGHQPKQRSVIKTNNKFSQAVAWGIAATEPLARTAAGVFTVVSIILAFTTSMSLFLLPVLMLTMPLIVLGAECLARHKLKKTENLSAPYVHWDENKQYLFPLEADYASWHANNLRNTFGYVVVPLVAVAALISLISLSAVGVMCPPLLLVMGSPVVLPILCAAASALFLSLSSLYMHMTRNEQKDDRYKLDYSKAPIGCANTSTENKQEDDGKLLYFSKESIKYSLFREGKKGKSFIEQLKSDNLLDAEGNFKENDELKHPNSSKTQTETHEELSRSPNLP